VAWLFSTPTPPPDVPDKSAEREQQPVGRWSSTRVNRNRLRVAAMLHLDVQVAGRLRWPVDAFTPRGAEPDTGRQSRRSDA
jgi:hypothetical protein